MQTDKPKRKYTRKVAPPVPPPATPLSAKKGSPSSPKGERKNELYANLMGELLTIMVKKGDNIRARVYRRAQETILAISEDIHEPADLAGKPGIGPIILEKLETFDKTGTIDIIERERENPENILSDVYGVGPKKAKELVEKGITSIAQLRERQDEVLNDVQKVGLAHYEDIMEKIPRKEIDEYAEIFQTAFKTVSKTTPMQYEIVGSYRRGASASGDIDVIITAETAAAFNEWIDELLSKKIIIEVLSRGKSKCLVITRLKEGYRARRVDFLYTTPEEYPFAVLYFTGSKGFNATMRGYALTRGLSLNEHGLSKMVDKKKEEKLSLNIVDERGIFDYLGLVYKQPEERIDGRAVVTKNGKGNVEPLNDFFVNSQKKSEFIKPKSIEKGQSHFSKRENNTPKVSEIPTDPKELESFCVNLLQNKKDAQKEMPKSVSPKEKMGELPKGPIMKKPRKNKTAKIAKVLPGSPKVPPGEPTIPIVLGPEGPIIKKPKKAKTEKIAKEPKEPKSNKTRKTKPEKIAKEPLLQNIEMAEQSPKSLGSPKQLNKQEENIDIEPIEKIEYPKLDTHRVPIAQKGKEPKNKTQKVPKVPKMPKVPKQSKTKKGLETPIEQPNPAIQNTTNDTTDIKVSKQVIALSIGEPMSTKTQETAKSTIEQFKNKGITVLEKLSQDQLVELLQVANANYYNEKGGLMTDNEYDIVKEYIEKKYPKNAVIKQIGAPIAERAKNKVELPYEMWSMDKIKPDSNALPGWMKKYRGPYVLSCKLDGVSGLYSTEGPVPKLYTRGDGKIGQDVSFLLASLKLPQEKGIVVRGEFIIPKKVFAEKYAKTFANPRNLVSGIVNSKKADAKAADLHFVTYEVISPQLKPSEQLAKLKATGVMKNPGRTTEGFEVVRNETRDTLSNESLSETLVDWRTNYEYEIDGIIVTDDAIYPRISGNPEHAFAFKMVLSDQKAEVKVVDVLWSPSKDGFLKPRVQIEPVRLGGVTIEYATGYNAKFIEDNKIGIGATVEIIRSGDVIPKILSVTVPAEKSKMPEETYKWNDTHVDVLLENAGENATVQEKNLTMFFSTLEVDGLKAGNIKKLMAAGYNTIPQIVAMTKEDFAKVGYKTLADKYVENIREKIAGASTIDLMVASGTMGRGLGAKKLEPILAAHPDILVSKDTPADKIAKVRAVKGIENKTATLFVENIPRFIEFLESIGEVDKAKGAKPPVRDSASVPADVDTANPLYGKKIMMTKVRDAEIIRELKARGATLEDTIGSKTFVLIVKSLEDVSNKTKYAVEHNIPIMTPEEFKGKYLASGRMD